MLYIDDLLIVGNSRKHIDSIKLLLGSQYKMVDLGPITCFLGLCFRRDRSKQLIFIDQEDYVSSVLEHFNMANCKPSHTPLPAGAVLERSTDQVPASDSFHLHFQSIIGSICDDGGHQFFTLTQTGSVSVPLLQPVNETFDGYKHVTHLEGNGYNCKGK
jgi:hypothetical protein